MDFLGLRNLDVIDKACALIGVARHRLDSARRQGDLRDARSRRGDRRLPVRELGHARRAQAGQADRASRTSSRSSRSTGRGRWRTSRSTRAARRARSRSPTPTRASRRSPPTRYGICIYQEQYMEIAKKIAGFTPAEADDLRKAIGKKIHSLMASLKGKFLEGSGVKRTFGRHRQPALGRHGAGPGLLVQQVPCRLLRAHRLPDGLAEGAPPEGVHGGAHLLRDEHEGQGAVLRQRVPRPRDRRAAARREHVDDRLRGRRGEDPLRAERREERRRVRVPRDRACPRRGRGVHLDLGLHRARRSAGREQARARVARQVRRARLHGRAAPRDARRARAGARVGAEAAVRQAARPGLDLRPRRADGRRCAAASSRDPRRRRVRQE